MANWRSTRTPSVYSGEVLEVATQALERIEEVVLAVELGNRCVKRLAGGVVEL